MPDFTPRSGLYPIPNRQPAHPIASEVSGIILELPSDPSVLENSDFKSRGFKKGGYIAIVSLFGDFVLRFSNGISINIHHRKNALGSLQEYVAVDWRAAAYAILDQIPTRVAAAALIQGLTALTQVTEAYYVNDGDTVLIHTVAGGAGLLHAQLAKARGATVIGTTSSTEKAELARAHGADHVILYKQENTVERVLELTNGEGVNVIYDGVGKTT